MLIYKNSQWKVQMQGIIITNSTLIYRRYILKRNFCFYTLHPNALQIEQQAVCVTWVRDQDWEICAFHSSFPVQLNFLRLSRAARKSAKVRKFRVLILMFFFVRKTQDSFSLIFPNHSSSMDVAQLNTSARIKHLLIGAVHQVW